MKIQIISEMWVTLQSFHEFRPDYGTWCRLIAILRIWLDENISHPDFPVLELHYFNAHEKQVSPPTG